MVWNCSKSFWLYNGISGQMILNSSKPFKCLKQMILDGLCFSPTRGNRCKIHEYPGSISKPRANIKIKKGLKCDE